jgi:hypothetical protein
MLLILDVESTIRIFEESQRIRPGNTTKMRKSRDRRKRKRIWTGVELAPGRGTLSRTSLNSNRSSPLNCLYTPFSISTALNDMNNLDLIRGFSDGGRDDDDVTPLAEKRQP